MIFCSCHLCRHDSDIPRSENPPLEVNSDPAPPSDAINVSPSMSPMSPTMAARISFQKLTNLIPLPSLPWSSPVLGSAASAAAASLCLVSSSSNNSIVAEDKSNPHSPKSQPGPSVRVRIYADRHQQLQRLRARLQEEQLSKSGMSGTINL